MSRIMERLQNYRARKLRRCIVQEQGEYPFRANFHGFHVVGTAMESGECLITVALVEDKTGHVFEVDSHAIQFETP